MTSKQLPKLMKLVGRDTDFMMAVKYFFGKWTAEKSFRCRDCKDFINTEHTENISIKEDSEQGLIDKSVHVNVAQQLNFHLYITQWSS